MASVRYSHRLRNAALVCLILLSCTVAQGKAQEEGDIRLTGGTHALQGYLEVYSKGKWGTVCNDRHWDEEDAKVVCRQISSIEGVMFAESPHTFSEVDASAPISMSKVKCDGTEKTITDCTFKNETTSCTHTSDVKMDCVIPGYKACVVYEAQNVPLTGRLHNPPAMSISGCTQLCRQDGYFYAGVAPRTCLCGSVGEDFEKYGVAPNSECNSLCQGEGSQGCGADERLAVHEVIVGSCSGSFKASKGSVASPGFPGSYPPDVRECQWFVDLSENGDTAVDFPVFKVADNDEVNISIDGGANWTSFKGTDYNQESPPQVPTFDAKKLMIKFSMAGSQSRTAHVAFVMTFRDNTTCEVIEVPNGSLDVVEGAVYRPRDTVKVLCDKKYRSEWTFAMCREDGFWYNAPVCIEAPPPGPSLVFTQTYLFMMLAVMGALGLIFFMVICGVICVGRKKKKEGYTGISRQESAEPTKAENEYHIDMREGSDMDMQHVGSHEEQAIPLASGAMDE